MSDELKCPKCSELMEEGFIIDSGGSASYQRVSGWVEGPPEMQEEKFFAWKMAPHLTYVGEERQRPISTYRCTGCGYLESYAR